MIGMPMHVYVSCWKAYEAHGSTTMQQRRRPVSSGPNRTLARWVEKACELADPMEKLGGVVLCEVPTQKNTLLRGFVGHCGMHLPR